MGVSKTSMDLSRLPEGQTEELRQAQPVGTGKDRTQPHKEKSLAERRVGNIIFSFCIMRMAETEK